MLSYAYFCKQKIQFFMYIVHKSIYNKIQRSAKKFKDFILKKIKYNNKKNYYSIFVQNY